MPPMPPHEPRPVALHFAQLGFPLGTYANGLTFSNIQASLTQVFAARFLTNLPNCGVMASFAEQTVALFKLNGAEGIVFAELNFREDCLYKSQFENFEYAVACGRIRPPSSGAGGRQIQIFVQDLTEPGSMIHLMIEATQDKEYEKATVSTKVGSMPRPYASLPNNFSAEMFLQNVRHSLVIE